MNKSDTKINGIVIQWIGHSTIGIYGYKIMYIDPFNEVLKGNEKIADIILSSHGHRDHFDIEAINMLSNENTTIVHTKGCATENLKSKKTKVIDSDQKISVEDIEIYSVHAYNIKRFRDSGEPFHPKGYGVGFIINFDNQIIYYAGDTDYIDEMNKLQKFNIDIAIVPIGGTYTMDIYDATNMVKSVNPKIAIPVHYNYIKGTEADPAIFKDQVEKNNNTQVIILSHT